MASDAQTSQIRHAKSLVQCSTALRAVIFVCRLALLGCEYIAPTRALGHTFSMLYSSCLADV